jgi:hypothetical protein
VTGGAALAGALDAERKAAVLRARGHASHRAVINRLQEPALRGAAFEPGATPARDRYVRHVGVHFHARHQRSMKSEAARNRIVVDLVFRSRRRVERTHLVGGFAGGN